jgi:hypothetical protein
MKAPAEKAKMPHQSGNLNNLTGCCPNRNPFEQSLKRFCQQIFAQWKISDVNYLSPQGEF